MLPGGYGESKGRFNDVFEYNTLSRSWRLVPVNGEVPKPVYLHSAVQHNNNMIVFGQSSSSALLINTAQLEAEAREQRQEEEASVSAFG